MNTQAALGENWYYESQGERVGPKTKGEMVALVDAGQVTYGTSVWVQGMADWVKAEQTDLRKELELRAPPPLSGEHVNNGIVWVLAVAPLIGMFLEYFVAYMVERNDGLAEAAADSGKYWFITLALNVALSLLDERALKKAGHDTSKFKGMAFLVPVYLYQRARALGHNLAYFITWLVTFALVLFA